MKHLLPIGAMTVVAFTSCLQPSLDEESSKLVTFHTSGISVETRASLAEAQITDLWVFDYVGDVMVQQVHQSSSASAFGSPTLSLSHGEHVLRFVASRGAEPIINEDVLSWSKPLDTFAAELPLTVDDATEETQSIILDRVVSRVKLLMNDKLPSNVSTAVFTLSNRSMGIDLSTMQASGGEEIEQEFDISSFAGNAGTSITVYTLLTDATSSTNVNVQLYDTDGNELINRTIENVPLKRNQQTTLQGYLWEFELSTSVSVTETWGADEELEY